MRKLTRQYCSILSLVLKRKWYCTIESGKKLEEYRDDSAYWRRRINNWISNGGFPVVEFRLGYGKPLEERRDLSRLEVRDSNTVGKDYLLIVVSRSRERMLPEEFQDKRLYNSIRLHAGQVKRLVKALNQFLREKGESR